MIAGAETTFLPTSATAYGSSSRMRSLGRPITGKRSALMQQTGRFRNCLPCRRPPSWRSLIASLLISGCDWLTSRRTLPAQTRRSPSSAPTGWLLPRVRPAAGRSLRSRTTRLPRGGPQARGRCCAWESPSDHASRRLGAPAQCTSTRQVLVPPGVPASPLSAATPISELVAALNAQQPEVLVGAVGIWRALAEEQIAGRLRIAPRAAFLSSEALTADVRRRVREAWEIEPVSGYAATEAPTIATSSPEHPELEIAEDVVVIEIVDEDGGPVPPGRPGAKVLLTNLINYAQPLIRYELTDSVVESPLSNPSRRPWRCLASVDGRTADILYLPGQHGTTVAVHPSVLSSAVAPIAEVGESAFVHDTRGLHAQVVLSRGAPADVPQRLRQAVIAAVTSTGAMAPAVDVQPVSTLAREPGGKLRLVRSV